MLAQAASVKAELADYEDSLAIHTPRVVFDKRTTWRSVHVRNITEQPAWYEVYIEPARHITADGSNVMADVPASLLEQLVETSASTVRLGGDEELIIELRAARPEGLPEGEYHTRLVFRQLPPPGSVEEAEQKEAQRLVALEKKGSLPPRDGVKIRIKPTEYSIPVQVRVGAMQADARLSSPELFMDGDSLWLALLMERDGQRSLFGDFKVLGLAAHLPRPDVLMIRKYIALDLPETEREVQLRLPDSIDLNRYDALKVEFRERERFGGDSGAILRIDLIN
ncbi:MAG: hypothetical protein OIF57_01735 [Marinobacterium sp.]|nr:hypothetical protein [Marinobacterium sp.]